MKQSTLYVDFNGGTSLICPYCNYGTYDYYFSNSRFKCPECNKYMRPPFYNHKKNNLGKKLNKGHGRFSLFNLYIKLRRYMIRRFYDFCSSS